MIQVNYAVGNNDPGYLPDGEPYVTSDADQAKRVLIADMLFNADHTDDEAEAEELTAWAEDLNMSDVSGGWSVIVADRAYWIEPTDEEPDDEGEEL